jgi:hypothetical protein
MDRISLIFLFLLILMGGHAGAEEAGDRGVLLDKQARLSQRIDLLKREQDLLVFRRAMYQSDSKYLLIDRKKRTGSLFYRHRLLRTFPVVMLGSKKVAGTRTVILTERTDGKPKKRMLIFGKDLVIQARKKSALAGTNKGLLRIEMGEKDLTALYSALETGARAYIL